MTGSAPTSLSERDLRAVLDFVGEAYDAQDLAEFRSVLMPGIHRLVASDYVAYNEVEQGRKAGFTLVSPDLPEWAHSAWGRHAGENPLLQRFLRTRDGRSRRFSEVASSADLQRTALYTELYQPLGLEHQIAFTLPSTPELTIGIALSRGGQNYSERDRRLLELVRPHLIQAYRAAQLRERMLGTVEGLRHGIDADGTAIVVVDADRVPAFISTAAAEFFGGRPGLAPLETGRPLEGPLGSWLDAGGKTGSLPVEGQEEPLLARCVRGDGGTRVILLERADRVLSIDALRQLGLTPREAEVLHGLAGGEDGGALASKLMVSPRTVSKHVQNIHAKLGVSSRAQAVATAWAAAAGSVSLGATQYIG